MSKVKMAVVVVAVVADRYDGRTARHSHFMCTKCNRIIDLDSKKIDHIMETAGENFHGEISDYSARFYGLCEDCSKGTPDNTDTKN